MTDDLRWRFEQVYAVHRASRQALSELAGEIMLTPPRQLPAVTARKYAWHDSRNIDTTDITRFGPTKNLPGPPWVLEFGYLTDSQACAGS